jgi:hypothetical protein
VQEQRDVAPRAEGGEGGTLPIGPEPVGQSQTERSNRDYIQLPLAKMGEGWSYESSASDAYLYHRQSGICINLTKASNGWFRFIPFEGSLHRICWSGASVSHQNFPGESADIIASLKAGGGKDVPETTCFGSWSITEEDHLPAVRNKSTSSQCIFLTCVGFVFLGSGDALIVENGKEVICSLEQGRQAMLAAAEKAEPEVTPSFQTT